MENVETFRRPRPWLWLAAVFYGGLIVVVSSIASDSMPDVDLVWSNDKLVHAAEYAVFAWLLSGALRTRYSRAVALVGAAVLCAGFGSLDELYQSTVPGRASSVYDALADTVGAVLGAAWGAVWWSREQRNELRP